MIYFSGISIRHLEKWDIPDDNPRFASVNDCYRMFLGMHLKMMRSDQESVDPHYNHYLACVEHFNSHLKLSYREYKNVVATLVDLYQQYFRNTNPRRCQNTLDNIGKFERLIYLFTNKTFPTQATNISK
ncbi:MAG TPA: hypothetical protein VM123_17165 [archaeon]|nr:hypothetical protein [archaeon]